MRLIHEPTVRVVGRQTIDAGQLAAFLEDHDASGWTTDTSIAAEVLAEVAGRLCYTSYARPRPGGNVAYLGHLKEVGHGSVLEHSVWNLIVHGISRSLSHELVRHRAGISPSQLSQRYVDESVAEYVVPPDLREEVDAARDYQAALRDGSLARSMLDWQSHHPRWGGQSWEAFFDKVTAGEAWLMSVRVAHDGYCRLSDYLARKATAARPDLPKTDARKFARQAARSVLPNATETKLFLTANARALRHFIELRCSRHADPEIRILAAAVLDVLKIESPNLFGDYEFVLLPDGTREAITPYRKV
jgi:thymidylate synthase (FAD)